MKGIIARTSRARAPKSSAIIGLQLEYYNINKGSLEYIIAVGTGGAEAGHRRVAQDHITELPRPCDIVRGAGGGANFHDVCARRSCRMLTSCWHVSSVCPAASAGASISCPFLIEVQAPPFSILRAVCPLQRQRACRHSRSVVPSRRASRGRTLMPCAP